MYSDKTRHHEIKLNEEIIQNMKIQLHYLAEEIQKTCPHTIVYQTYFRPGASPESAPNVP